MLSNVANGSSPPSPSSNHLIPISLISPIWLIPPFPHSPIRSSSSPPRVPFMDVGFPALGYTDTQSSECIGGKSSIFATDAGSFFKSRDFTRPTAKPDGNF